MFSLSDVVCPGLPGTFNIAFDGSSLCVVSESKSDIKALANVICGICPPLSGELTMDPCQIPYANRTLPCSLTVKEYVDTLCALNGSAQSVYSYELIADYKSRSIRNLSEHEKAIVALGVALSSDPDCAFLFDITSGLRLDQREDVINKMLSDEHDTFVIYSSDSESELKKSEYTLALYGGCQMFFGKTEEFIKKATEPSSMTVRVMGAGDSVNAFFDSYGVSAAADTKKNVYKATLPPTTDLAKLKSELCAARLHFIDAKEDADKISRLYCTLLENDRTLNDDYEQYKFENAGPKKLEISDLIFNEDEEDDE